MEEIGQVIRYHRRRAGLSQKDLARMAGIGKATVFDIEKGKQTVQMDSLLKIVRVLNIRLHLESPLMEEYGRIEKGEAKE